MHWTLGQEAWVWDVARSLCCVLRENTQPLQYGILVGNVVMNWHPIQGGVVILLLTSCLGKWDKFQLDGPLNSSTDQFFYLFGLPLILLCYLSPPSNLDNCQFVPSISKQTCRRARKEPSVPTCDLHLTQKNTYHRSGTGWGSNCQCAWLLISFVIIMIIFVCCDSPNTEKHNIFFKFFL